MVRKIPLNKEAVELRWNESFDSPTDALEKLLNLRGELEKNRADVLSAEIFAPKWAKPLLDKVFPNSKFPVNHILPLGENSSLGGIHIAAVSGANVKYLQHSGGIKSSTVSDGFANWFRSFGICSDNPGGEPYEHAKKNLEKMDEVLREAGFKFTDIVRTWFYNDDILSWYGDFNKARTEFWNEKKIFESLLPASTGIGAANFNGALIMSGMLAMNSEGCSGEWKASEADSPLQCGATKYGSSFSRAVEIKTPFHRRILVSGSASISPDGKTLHFGDIDKQIDLTMRVIREILLARGMDFRDTVRATIYCREPEYYPRFSKWQGDSAIPHVPAHSIVCRDDLMFEVELEAATTSV